MIPKVKERKIVACIVLSPIDDFLWAYASIRRTLQFPGPSFLRPYSTYDGDLVFAKSLLS